MGKKRRGFGGFLFGALVGAGIGVLFAPKSGKETRAELKEKFDDLVKKVKELDKEEVKEAFLNKIEEIKRGFQELDKEKVASIAKEKATALKDKIVELSKAAKEKATPAVENAVENVREKAIVVLKNTTDKLEKSEKKNKEEK